MIFKKIKAVSNVPICLFNMNDSFVLLITLIHKNININMYISMYVNISVYTHTHTMIYEPRRYTQA